MGANFVATVTDSATMYGFSPGAGSPWVWCSCNAAHPPQTTLRCSYDFGVLSSHASLIGWPHPLQVSSSRICNATSSSRSDAFQMWGGDPSRNVDSGMFTRVAART